eukprot:3088299-Prymnesium_polylepis.1
MHYAHTGGRAGRIPRTPRRPPGAEARPVSLVPRVPLRASFCAVCCVSAFPVCYSELHTSSGNFAGHATLQPSLPSQTRHTHTSPRGGPRSAVRPGRDVGRRRTG